MQNLDARIVRLFSWQFVYINPSLLNEMQQWCKISESYTICKVLRVEIKN